MEIDRLWKKRALLGTLLAAIFAVACSGSDTSQQTETARPASTQGAESSTTQPSIPDTQPNIIFILADDLNYTDAQQMPTLRSQLIEKGASFENGFVGYPLCCPSRATILTGLYAHNHSVKDNQPPEGGFQKFVSEGLEENTIATRLQEAGYKTALFGKYLNGYPGNDETHVPTGWDEWYGKLEEQELYDYRINQNGKVVAYDNDTEDFFTDVLSGQATDFVGRAASDARPFFMYVAPTAPHAPATPAERHKGAFAGEKAPRPPSFNEEDVSDKPPLIRNADRLSDKDISRVDRRYRKRLESMLAVDEMVDSLVRALQDADKLDETFIFFTSDNGLQQGEHRILGGKKRPYEESVRVPFFVRGPGVDAGSTVEKFALNTDFAPTFADLAGVSFSADGRSLAPLLRGEVPSWRSTILLEMLSKRRSEDVGDKGARGDEAGEAKEEPASRPPSDAPPVAYEAVRTETHKYVEYATGDKELYDLQADPYELDNVYETADPSLVEDLRTRLDALRGCDGEACQQAEDAPQLHKNERQGQALSLIWQ